MSSTTDIVRTTCPRDCYDACGIVVKKRDGAIAVVAGDPGHPVSRGSLCGKCAVAYNGKWRSLDSRLLRPQRRVGAKGTGSFTACSWDEALTLIANKLQGVLHNGNPQQIFHTHYTGTCSLLAGNFPLRFFNRLGAVEVDPDTVCNKAGHSVLRLIFGDSLLGFDPRTQKDANCIIVWGANPSSTAPHVHRFWLKETKAYRIIIDPIRHPTAAAADLHLQLRPGTDAALAFAMLHVLRREKLIDQSFLGTYALGWDEIESQLEVCTPEWGQSVTGVPASDIIKAATAYGKGPSLLWLGQGVQRQRMGGNVFRALSLLPIATGNLGKPGTGFLYMNGLGGRGINIEQVTTPHLNPNGPTSVSHMDLAAILEDAKRSKVLFTWNNNIAASSPQQARLMHALRREDLFHVAIDLFATDTVDFADVVLPAASFLEFDDLVLSYFNWTVSAQVKAMEPLGESLPNQDIFRRLAGAMGFNEPELHETNRSLIERLLKSTGIELNFDQLAKIGTVDWSPEPVVQFAGLRFPTPSGKIEITGERFSKAGLPEAPRPIVDPPPAPGHVRVLSPAALWLMNSSYHQEERLRRRMGPQKAFINPKEAALRGLNDGDVVTLQNSTGSLVVAIGIESGVPLQTLLLHKGRWPKHEPSGHNINVLNPGNKTDLAESSCVHSIEVTIAKVPEPQAQPEGGPA
jgi:anaerobic selenocysteine-containing dehydrogenase